MLQGGGILDQELVPAVLFSVLLGSFFSQNLLGVLIKAFLRHLRSILGREIGILGVGINKFLLNVVLPVSDAYILFCEY